MWKILTTLIREEIYYLLIPWAVSRGTERMPQGSKNKWLAVRWLTHFQGEQTEPEIYCHGVDWPQKHLRYHPAKLNNRFRKMCQRADKVLKFITETMKNRKVDLTAEGKTLAEVRIRSGIILSDVLRTFYVCNCSDATQLHKQEMPGWIQNYKIEKINYLVYMENIYLFVKRIGDYDTILRIYNLHLIGMIFGIEKYAMFIIKIGKPKRNNGKDRSIKKASGYSKKKKIARAGEFWKNKRRLKKKV